MDSTRSESSIPLGAIPFRISPEKCRKSRDREREARRSKEKECYNSPPKAAFHHTMPTKPSVFVSAYSTSDCTNPMPPRKHNLQKNNSRDVVYHVGG